MKKILANILLLMICQMSSGQSVGINNNGTSPDSSAMLDISSNSKGILIPRLRTSERLAINNPAIGLMVFDIDTWSFWYFAIGSVWKEIANNIDGPKGNAGGDLGGTYPNPHIKGLAFKPFANLNPGHLQIIKWENDADEWQFRNDSLMLPYNVVDTSAGSLFSITNTKPGYVGSVMVGRYNGGSGTVPSFSGVWGDHTIGNGISGTSNSGFGVLGNSISGNGISGNSTTGIGIIGTSNGNHAVYGDGNSGNHAGVYGRNPAGGHAVWGDATTGNGYAVYGSNASSTPGSRAGMFKNTNTSSTATVLEANTVGLGRGAEFTSLNSSNTQSAVYVLQNGTGSGLSSKVLSTGITSAAVDASNNGNGAGVSGHSVSGDGIRGSSINNNAGYFETVLAGNTNATLAINNNSAGHGLLVEGNSNVNTTDLGRFLNLGTGGALRVMNNNTNSTGAAAFFSNIGLGASLYVERSNDISNSPAALIYNNGNAAGLDVQNLKQGTAIKLANFDASNTVPVILAEHNGSGRGIELRLTKTTNNSYGAYIKHDGIGTGLFIAQTATGKGAEINIGNAANTQPGLFINSAATLGAEISILGNTSPVGLKSTIAGGALVNNGIAILGIANANDYNGIGVKGIGDGGVNASNSIGVLGEGKPGTNAIGVKGVSYRDDTQSGAVTAINLAISGGTGVYGEASGGEGFGVMGVVGNTGNHSVAARFKNNYTGNLRPVVEVFSNGKGSAIYCNNTNATGNDVQIRVGNAGTGDFLRFTDGLGFFVTSIAKNGNFKTDGTVTVKDNYGILRSSTGTQLRTEIVQAVMPVPLGMVIGSGASHDFAVTFAEAFAQPPTVSFGNLFNLAANPEAAFLVGTVNSVSTTGCNIKVMNPMSFGVTLVAGTATWRLIAIGPE